MSSTTSDSTAEQRDLLVRALLTVIHLAQESDRSSIDNALDAFGKALSNNGALASFERTIQDLKEVILKMAIEPQQAAPPTTFIQTDGYLPIDTSVLMPKIRDGCLEILNNFDIDIDSDYVEKLSLLRKKIGEAQSPEIFLSFRTEIDEILKRYVLQIFEERKKFAGFLAEVSQRINDLEKYFMFSVKHFQEHYELNDEFDAKLGKEINQTATSIRDANHIEKLKNAVLAKLSSMTKAIEDKQQQDKNRRDVAHQELGGFRDELDRFHEKVTKVQQENKVLLQKLKIDPLTGAYNRLAYEEALAEELSRYRRYKRPFSLIIFDLDHFKEINDNFGHTVGDKCLQEVVKCVKPGLRHTDILARFGGDEFLVMMPETPKANGLTAAEKIRQRIEVTDFLVRGQKVPLTISLGVTEVKKADANPEAVIDRADRALYQAKRDGRNRVGSL